jgi:hypothetical protein
MTERQGAFTIPTRLYVSLEHRVLLERLVRAQGGDLADLVSQIVADYLDALPDRPPVPVEPPPDRTAELRARRSELARLRARRDAAGPSAPSWLHAYIAELEDELGRGEG